MQDTLSGTKGWEKLYGGHTIRTEEIRSSGLRRTVSRSIESLWLAKSTGARVPRPSVDRTRAFCSLAQNAINGRELSKREESAFIEPQKALSDANLIWNHPWRTSKCFQVQPAGQSGHLLGDRQTRMHRWSVISRGLGFGHTHHFADIRRTECLSAAKDRKRAYGRSCVDIMAKRRGVRNLTWRNSSKPRWNRLQSISTKIVRSKTARLSEVPKNADLTGTLGRFLQNLKTQGTVQALSDGDFFR